MFGGEETAHRVYIQHLSQGCQLKILQDYICAFENAGGLHQRVQLAVGLGDAGAHRRDAGLVGYVHPHKGGVGRLRSCLALSLVEIGHNDCRAPLGAEQRGGLADARRAADHKNCFVFQVHIVFILKELLAKRV